MISWFNTPFSSTILIVLAIIYQIIASVTLYDISFRLSYKTSARTNNLKPIPVSFLLLHWTETVMFILLFLLNWKFAIITWLIKSLLQALYILEFIGYIILYSFSRRR
jgi:hypothetical protein